MSEETPVEQPPASEEQPKEETPAATTEEPKADDQPAVTEVTEVTEEKPSEPPAEDKPKEEEKPAEEKKEEVKEKPKKTKPTKPPPDYKCVKSGWIEKQGLIFKSFKRYFMSLDEGGSTLRWWKTEQRTGSDGAIYLKYCAEITEPNEQYTTNWPEGARERALVICTPNRAFYIICENVDEKNDWIQKLTEAKEKHGQPSLKVVSTALFSVEALKASLGKAEQDAQKTIDSETKKKEEEPKKEEQPPPAAEGATAAAPTTEETKKEETTPGEVTVEVEVTEEPKQEEPPKTEEPKQEEPKTEEAKPEEEPKTEEPKEEEPKPEEPAKDEQGAAEGEGGE